MGFIKKIWKDRISEFPTRRSLTKTDGTSELVTVARSEGMISEEGDAFSAENMNDFENRVANGFSELNEKYIDKTWSFDLSVDAGAAYNTPKNITVDRYAPYAINTFALNSERIIISRLAFNGNNLSLLLGNTSPVKVNINLTVNVRYKKI